MRKLTLILLSVLLVTCLFVSCDVEKNVRESDTVTLRFRTDDNSRALTATRDDLDTAKYYWYYTATKSEGDKTPATGKKTKPTAVTKSNDADAMGLSGIVGPFSLGTWNFELYAYTEAQTFSDDNSRSSSTYINEKCVYYGKTADTGYVLDEDTKTIDITVSPQKATNGTGNLYIEKGINFTANGKTYSATDVVVTNVNKTAPETVDTDSNETYWKYSNKAVGSYKVTVFYKNGDITCATNTIYVNVWNNLTTTVSGTLDEIKVSPTFNAVEDPGTGAISQVTSVQDKTETVYVFDYSPASNEYSGSSNELETTVKGTFARNTGADSATLTVTTYNLVSASADKKATFTVTDNNSAVAAVTATLEGATFVENSVAKIATYISKDLTDVKMYHSNTAMDETAKTSADAVTENGNWYYDKTTGLLVFATSSFSTFHVTSSVNVYDKDNNTAYTLATSGEATIKYIIKGSDGSTKSAEDLGSNLVLLDCSLSNNVPDEFTSKNWEVIHKNCSKAENYYHNWNETDFSGGWGTKVEPYLIKDKEQFQNITDMYGKYAYYRIKDNVKEIDCSNWTQVELYGSFDGNGVTLKGIDNKLFRYIGKMPSSAEEAKVLTNWDTRPITLKNYTANFSVEGSLDIASGMIFQINGNNTTTFEDVTVSGIIQGGSNSGVFFNYTGCNLYDTEVEGMSQKVILEGCSVTAALVNPSGLFGVIAGHPAYKNPNIEITCDRDIGSLHSNYANDSTSTGKVGYFAVSGGFTTEKIKISTSSSSYATPTSEFTCKTLTKETLTLPEDGKGYLVAWPADANRMEVYIAAQLDETDSQGNKTSVVGITMGLAHLKTIENKANEAEHEEVLSSFSSVELTPKQESYSAELNGTSLKCTTGGGANGANYTCGKIKLQVALFNSDNVMIAYVNEIIAEKDSAEATWTITSGK